MRSGGSDALGRDPGVIIEELFAVLKDNEDYLLTPVSFRMASSDHRFTKANRN